MLLLIINLQFLPRILSAMAYNYKNGPWKFGHVKYGYDPTRDSEAAKYQTIDIAVTEKDNIDQLRS